MDSAGQSSCSYAYVTVQDKKVYVAGGVSPVGDAKHQVYIYDVRSPAHPHQWQLVERIKVVQQHQILRCMMTL